ncbi:MAG: hypothetical protein JNK87_03930 [Bryobacterales bacterium]|nr:hypothetical protein [Bryobacterales bacterium]
MAVTIASVLMVSLLMGGHMPFQTGDGAPAARLATGHWQAVYVLGERCPCSTRVARYLMGRSALGGIEEFILQVGEEPETEAGLTNAGWQMRRRPPEIARDHYGARSAPLFVIVDPTGEVRYRGGLSRRTDSRDGFHDREIWEAVRAGRAVTPLPAYGCALRFGCEWGGVSQALER